VNNMNWSPQQYEALQSVARWWAQGDSRKQIFRLFGYAGTGKTTLAIDIAEEIAGGDALFGSFTGKAALVMRKKGCHGARTLHSLIYKPRRKHREETEEDKAQNIDPNHDLPAWEINPDSELRDAALLIIDECSMVGDDLARDVLSFRKPVLVLGDPAQLPPVSGTGAFTEGHEPDVMLTEIHRQAADNPIVRIATDIRMGKRIELGAHKGATDKEGVWIISRDRLSSSTELCAEQILCGRNDTRVTINRRIRKMLREQGKLPAPLSPQDEHLPVIGDRVICLKNKRQRGLLNGAMWKVEGLRDRSYGAKKPGRKDVSYLDVASIDQPGFETDVAVPHAYWYWNGKAMDLQLPEKMTRGHYDEFDYAYAITCHKSQGSQWDKVLVFDESAVFGRDASTEDIPARWLYTACTRAASALIVVVG